MLTDEPQALLRQLPPDSSPLLPRLIELMSATRTLGELHVLSGIPMPTLFHLAAHLYHHRKARVVVRRH